MKTKDIAYSDYKPDGAHAVFWRYFVSLLEANDGQLPKRTDFDPVKIASVMGKLAVSEYVDEQTQLVRLVGGGHDNLWPESLSGKNLFDFVDAENAGLRRMAYKEIIGRPCACIIKEEATDKTGHTIYYSGLVVPTQAKDGTPTIFIGCYDFSADDLEMKMSSDAGIGMREVVSIDYVSLPVAI